MTKQRTKSRPLAEERPAAPDEVVDRLGGLLPREQLEEALEGLAPEEITGPGGLLVRWVAQMLGQLAAERCLDHPPGELGQRRRAAPATRAMARRRRSRPSSARSRSRRPWTARAAFEPQLVRKRQTRLAGLDERVLGLYAGRMSVRDIAQHLSDLYGTTVGRDTISTITDAVLADVEAWRTRPLEPVYPIVYFDALMVEVREDRSVTTRACYLAIAVTSRRGCPARRGTSRRRSWRNGQAVATISPRAGDLRVRRRGAGRAGRATRGAARRGRHLRVDHARPADRPRADARGAGDPERARVGVLSMFDNVDLSNPRTTWMANLSDGAGAILLRRDEQLDNVVLETAQVVDAQFIDDVAFASPYLDEPITYRTRFRRFLPAHIEVVNKERLKERLDDIALPSFIRAGHESLARSGFAADQVDFVGANTMKPSLWHALLDAFGLRAEDQISLADVGHAGYLDQLLFLQALRDERRLPNGGVALLATPGVGFQWTMTTIAFKGPRLSAHAQ
jgi:Transposase, Mutator family/3-Oxoacyl-[acyl-carrier-protein (ACP)] synthase III C terminal